ncbi:MAG: DUF4197 domain-containing protein [Pseudomonadota bacterium]
MNKKLLIASPLFFSMALVPQSLLAGSLSDLLQQGEDLLQQAGLDEDSGLDAETVVRGLKEALEKGTGKAVDVAGVQDGYFKNPRIKIPLPEQAEKYGDRLRKLGLGKYVDNLEQSINRAAENAAPLATQFFLDALTGMSIEDGYDILRGPDDAATRYFDTQTRPKLTQVFRTPIDQSLSDVGAISAYKKLQKKADKVGLASKFSFDMSDYVTERALDGLFVLVADEEKNIRDNPVARTSELLKQVFE